MRFPFRLPRKRRLPRTPAPPVERLQPEFEIGSELLGPLRIAAAFVFEGFDPPLEAANQRLEFVQPNLGIGRGSVDRSPRPGAGHGTLQRLDLALKPIQPVGQLVEFRRLARRGHGNGCDPQRNQRVYRIGSPAWNCFIGP